MTARPKVLLNIDRNFKTVKGQKKGYMTAILYLAPAKLSGYEVCPMRSAGCTAGCLNTAGRGRFSMVQQARIAKTKWYFEDRPGFMAQLVKELSAFIRKAARKGLTPVVRLNGTSDISWERVSISLPWSEHNFEGIMQRFPEVQFYDYTKITKRALAYARGDMPSNYVLTFSLTEANDEAALAVVRAGGNVAVVFKGPLPRGAVFRCHTDTDTGWTLVGRDYDYTIPVVDGDENDLRFLDRKGVVVGLKAKGKARYDTSGFVRA